MTRGMNALNALVDRTRWIRRPRPYRRAHGRTVGRADERDPRPPDAATLGDPPSVEDRRGNGHRRGASHGVVGGPGGPRHSAPSPACLTPRAGHRCGEALGTAGRSRRTRGPRRAVLGSLRGLEASAHGHRQHRQRSEGVHDLLEHVISFLPVDDRWAELSSACTGHRPRAPTWPAPLRCTAGASTLRASLASDHLLRFSSRAASTERPCPRISRWPRPLIGRYRTLGRSLVGDDGPGLVCIARTKHRGDGVVTGWATRPSPPPRR